MGGVIPSIILQKTQWSHEGLFSADDIRGLRGFFCFPAKTGELVPGGSFLSRKKSTEKEDV